VNPASVLSVENLVAPYSVLYVEDNPANLHLVEQIVARRADVHFFSATDAGSGIALARSHQPDVILMDINLPGISGMDAMQILRADPRTAHIPILALSANALPRDIEHALAAGFVDYITKPIRVNTLMRSLDAALLLSQQDRVPTTTTRETKFAKESP
jgi:CheY-like chemotaxis protein